MNGENKTLSYGSLVFRFYFESDKPYHDLPFMSYSRHFNTGNAKKVFKEARRMLRYYIRKYNRDIGVEMYLDMYELSEQNPETHIYIIGQKVYTKYVGLMCCFVISQFREWYWSYNRDGELHITKWTERSK